jgi:Ca2+-binding RTX toxin-like protein
VNADPRLTPGPSFTLHHILIDGGRGNDTLVIEDDKFRRAREGLFNADGHTTLNGGAGDDSILGGPFSELLRGGNGRDTLRGGDGDDQLYGYRGSDVLDGEGGGAGCLSTARGPLRARLVA